tara:strand:+ start:34727 stop:35959 length:1233 start_codon:yes stop_codon:yes gene_type:complete
MNIKKIIWSPINHKIVKSTTKYTKPRSCPICKSEDYFTILKFKNYQFFTDSRISKRINLINVQCKKCFAIYQNPAYTFRGLKVLFNEAGMSYGSTIKSKKDQINWLKKNKLIFKNINVLDVGCYDGSFLKLLPKKLNKHGVDIDKKIILNSQKKHKNLKLFCGNFETFSSKKKFDLITMMHVLEHLPNPVKVLKNLKKNCINFGKLVIEVPIIENHMFESLDGFITTQHMTHFSKNSLFNAIHQSGWKVCKYKKIKKYNGFRVICEKNNKNDENLKILKRDLINYEKYKLKNEKNKNRIIKKLSNFNLNKKNILMCGGLHLELIYQLTSLLREITNKKFIIIDNDRNKVNKKWRGVPIYGQNSIKYLGNLNKYKFIICSYPYQDEIFKELIKLEVEKKNIFKFYSKIQRY